MESVPKGGLFGKIYHIFKWASSFRVELHAAFASYFIIMSLFPTLVLLLGLLRYTGLDVSSLLNILEGFIPEVFHPLVSEAVEMIYRNSTGTVLSISAIGALWSASKGVYGLMVGLNAIYGVKESRGYIYTRTVSVFYMFAFLALLVLTLVLNVYSQSLFDIFSRKHPVIDFFGRIVNFRFLLLAVLQFLLFTAIYKFLPNGKMRIWSVLPGAALSVAGWLVFSKIYSVYVTRFSHYAGIYDSLYSMALGMLWLYFCICIVFYGGILNRALTERNLAI